MNVRTDLEWQEWEPTDYNILSDMFTRFGIVLYNGKYPDSDDLEIIIHTDNDLLRAYFIFDKDGNFKEFSE